MKLYIIRHGDPDYANDCLTPLGKRQAEALGRRFANTDLDMVFISPLGRAQETAKPTCEIKKLHASNALRLTYTSFCALSMPYLDNTMTKNISET